MSDINRPTLGEPNEACRTCGAPLAADQRYCLQCGSRRAEARLPFLEILARQLPATAGAGQPAAAETARRGPAGLVSRIGTNAAAVAGVACLLLALGVGVLIGGLGGDDAGAGTPQVISVGGAAPAAAPVQASMSAPATTTTAQDDAGASTKGNKKSAGTDAAASSKQSKASNKTVENLDSTSGKDYSKKSAKLPKTVGTGGKAPPVDKSKPIGDGSDVEEIG